MTSLPYFDLDDICLPPDPVQSVAEMPTTETESSEADTKSYSTSGTPLSLNFRPTKVTLQFKPHRLGPRISLKLGSQREKLHPVSAEFKEEEDGKSDAEDKSAEMQPHKFSDTLENIEDNKNEQQNSAATEALPTKSPDIAKEEKTTDKELKKDKSSKKSDHSVSSKEMKRNKSKEKTATDQPRSTKTDRSKHRDEKRKDKNDRRDSSTRSSTAGRRHSSRSGGGLRRERSPDRGREHRTRRKDSKESSRKEYSNSQAQKSHDKSRRSGEKNSKQSRSTDSKDKHRSRSKDERDKMKSAEDSQKTNAKLASPVAEDQNKEKQHGCSFVDDQVPKVEVSSSTGGEELKIVTLEGRSTQTATITKVDICSQTDSSPLLQNSQANSVELSAECQGAGTAGNVSPPSQPDATKKSLLLQNQYELFESVISGASQTKTKVKAADSSSNDLKSAGEFKSIGGVETTDDASAYTVEALKLVDQLEQFCTDKKTQPIVLRLKLILKRQKSLFVKKEQKSKASKPPDCDENVAIQPQKKEKPSPDIIVTEEIPKSHGISSKKRHNTISNCSVESSHSSKRSRHTKSGHVTHGERKSPPPPPPPPKLDRKKSGRREVNTPPPPPPPLVMDAAPTFASQMVAQQAVLIPVATYRPVYDAASYLQSAATVAPQTVTVLTQRDPLYLRSNNQHQEPLPPGCSELSPKIRPGAPIKKRYL